jgi:Domain of unknown function (DUF4389)
VGYRLVERRLRRWEPPGLGWRDSNRAYVALDRHSFRPTGVCARSWPYALIKWLLAIPHYFVLIFLGVGAVVAVILAWFAILFTGTYPRSLFDFVVGVIRWSNRVTGYAFALVIDAYPPFSLS